MDSKLKSNSLRVIIADKNQIYSNALEKFIQKENNIELLSVCNTEEELSLTINSQGMNCLIVDEGFFEQDAVTEIRAINKQDPNLKIVGLSIDGSSHMQEDMLLAGAYKFISKWNLENELHLLINEN